MKFRKLKPDEIDVRISRTFKTGVSLLLYKNARVDQQILDETVGPMNWEREHSRDNANCIVSIWDADKSQWVHKEDTGVCGNMEREKSVASDSFKRACVNWGIGRELYTAPDIVVGKDKLNFFSEDNGKYYCADKFEVTDIQYDGDSIKNVTIGIVKYGRITAQLKYSNHPLSATSAEKTPAPAPSQTSATAVPKSAPAPEAVKSAGTGITDDTKILIGNCRGKTYGEVKDTAAFISFLKWIKGAPAKVVNGETVRYDNPAQQAQFVAFARMAQTI